MFSQDHKLPPAPVLLRTCWMIQNILREFVFQIRSFISRHESLKTAPPSDSKWRSSCFPRSIYVSGPATADRAPIRSSRKHDPRRLRKQCAGPGRSAEMPAVLPDPLEGEYRFGVRALNPPHRDPPLAFESLDDDPENMISDRHVNCVPSPEFDLIELRSRGPRIVDP